MEYEQSSPPSPIALGDSLAEEPSIAGLSTLPFSTYAMHLVCLLKMGQVASSQGTLSVRRPGAESLLETREGALDDASLLAAADEMPKDLQAVNTAPVLPTVPNAKGAEAPVVKLHHRSLVHGRQPPGTST